MGKIVLPATFRARQTTTLHARVSGYLTAWHRELGARVKAGDLLAEIETPELDQEVAESEALAREADAAAVQAKAERMEAQAALRVARAQLVRAQAQLELAKSQLVRREKLLKSKTISQEEHDTYERDLEARAADVTAAEAEVARQRTNLQTRAAIIEAREATAKSRQANVDRLKELQAFKRIVAPFDGVVTSRTAEVGMLVTPGKESLFVIDDISRIRVQLNVPQTYAMRTSPGVKATVTVPESALPPVQGTITRVAEAVDSTNRTMLAEIEVENTSHRLQPGSYAQVTLSAPDNDANWTIPTNTLSMRPEGPHVAIVNDRNEIQIQRVSLGRDLGTRVIVTDGIGGKERLVVNPLDDLKNGSRVQVSHHDEPAQELAQR
jgi:multidrug efflux pump subunit AcrA (membrane-fusion protein)